MNLRLSIARHKKQVPARCLLDCCTDSMPLNAPKLVQIMQNSREEATLMIES